MLTVTGTWFRLGEEKGRSTVPRRTGRAATSSSSSSSYCYYSPCPCSATNASTVASVLPYQLMRREWLRSCDPGAHCELLPNIRPKMLEHQGTGP